MNFLKHTLVVLCTFLTFSLSSQDNNSLDKRHELKLNVAYLLTDAAEISYEYILNEESSVGISATYVLIPEAEFGWGITPYYRLFFGKKPAQGFFIEGQASIFDFEDFDWICSDDLQSCSRFPNRYTTGGVGLAIGAKFKTSKNIVLEIYAGGGRILADVN